MLENPSSLDEPPSQYLLADILTGDPTQFYWIGFTSIAVLLVMSGIISASEVAFFSLKGDDLERCRESDDPRKRGIVELLKNPRLLLATILVMNNFVNVAIVTLATFIMWEMVGTREPTEMVVGIVTFVVTFAITFFGEIVPKVYATQRNVSFARMLSSAWSVLKSFAGPLPGH